MLYCYFAQLARCQQSIQVLFNLLMIKYLFAQWLFRLVNTLKPAALLREIDAPLLLRDPPQHTIF